MSTSYHPQIDGQSKRLNQCLETYLRCIRMSRQTQWNKWLSQAEWWYNTHFHSGAKLSPFKALYGYDAPHVSFHYLGDIKDHMAKQFCIDKNKVLQVLKDNLHNAQNR